MNKLYRLLIMILTATLLFACKDDEETASGGLATLEISDADKSHSFDLNGGSKTVNVTASAMFTVEMAATDWLTVSEIGKTGFKINVDENANIESRNVKLILSLKGAENIEIDVSQSPGSSTLAADRQTVEFNSGTNETVIFINSTTYTATVSGGANWLTAAVAGTRLRISAERNANTEERSAQIIVHVDGFQDVTLTVRQAAYVPPTLSINPQSLEFDYLESEQTIVVTTNRSDFTAAVEDGIDWITVQIVGSSLRVKADYNYGNPRNATVILNVEDVNVVLNVTQVDDGRYVALELPVRKTGNYKRDAVEWQGQLGSWGADYGILAYRVTVTGSGRLKITDHISPAWNIWFLLYNDRDQADKGNHASLIDGDGTIEYTVAPGTYYVFGILNSWYEDLMPYDGDIDYDIEISLSN